MHSRQHAHICLACRNALCWSAKQTWMGSFGGLRGPKCQNCQSSDPESPDLAGYEASPHAGQFIQAFHKKQTTRYYKYIINNWNHERKHNSGQLRNPASCLYSSGNRSWETLKHFIVSPLPFFRTFPTSAHRPRPKQTFPYPQRWCPMMMCSSCSWSNRCRTVCYRMPSCKDHKVQGACRNVSGAQSFCGGQS